MAKPDAVLLARQGGVLSPRLHCAALLPPRRHCQPWGLSPALCWEHGTQLKWGREGCPFGESSTGHSPSRAAQPWGAARPRCSRRKLPWQSQNGPSDGQHHTEVGVPAPLLLVLEVRNSGAEGRAWPTLRARDWHQVPEQCSVQPAHQHHRQKNLILNNTAKLSC